MAFALIRNYKGDWRFELKYRLAPAEYHAVRGDLQPLMEADPYTGRSPTGLYLVRSLYFDTDSYQAYHEKIAGDYGRIKMRLRTYSEDPGPDTLVRVELKTRRGAVMEKHRCPVSVADYDYFMRERHWPSLESPVLVEFERLLHLRVLRPKVLVQYLREGLRARSREDLRITFDHEVRSAEAGSLFPDHLFFRDHHRHVIVMEVKCHFRQPPWLSALIRRHGLKLVANSKFTRAIEVSRPDVVTRGLGAT